MGANPGPVHPIVHVYLQMAGKCPQPRNMIKQANPGGIARPPGNVVAYFTSIITHNAVPGSCSGHAEMVISWRARVGRLQTTVAYQLTHDVLHARRDVWPMRETN